MNFRFFKRKLEPKPLFTTIEVEFNGATYGYFLNWFKKNGSQVEEVKISDLPEAVINFKVDTIISHSRNELEVMLNQFRQSLIDRIDSLDKVLGEIPTDEI